MRSRIWIFAALVAAALALHLAVLSAKVAQLGEDNVRAHVALSTSALRGQLELLDARLSPRAVAAVPELIEATRAPPDPTEPLAKPDEKALRAAASALSPEPDLLAVVNGQGAIVSRRSKPLQTLDDASQIPLAKAALEGNPAPSFATWDGAVWRIAAARIPGNGAAVVVGTVVDDRFAAQLKSQIDADVTLVQGGKVLASSLPADERARVVRWTAAPAPGYGVLQVRLPGIGNQLSGKLPRGATRYAVRGAILPIDSGVTAALTVPAAPYLAWLGRYQAFYVAALVLFLLFSLLWGLLARAPKPVMQVVEKPAPQPARVPAPRPPSLVGTDVGEPRSVPPPTDDVPWQPAPVSEPPPAEKPRQIESLDPEVPPPATAESEHHPMWSADPFTPTPGQITAQEAPAEVSAEEIGLVEAKAEPEPEVGELPMPETPAEPELAPPPAPAEDEEKSSAAKGDFSFAGLLDEAHAAPEPPPEEPRPSLAQDYADTTSPGNPSDELLAEARGESTQPNYAGYAAGDGDHKPFPGDEPTRVEPVSAALLDKLRERDEEEPALPATGGALRAEHPEAEPPAEEPAPPAEEAAPPAPAQQGWGSLVDESDKTMETLPPQMEPEAPPPAPEANVTMQDFSMPAEPAEDPDEQHWRETFDKFKELKAQLGEPADRISFEKFATKLRKNRADLLAKHNCKGVRFSVYEKDGKAAIKASAIR